MDVEVIAAAMVVSWKAQKWGSFQRLSAFLAGKGGVPVPVLLNAGQVGKGEGMEEGEERGDGRRVVPEGLSAHALKDWKTMLTLRSMTDILRRIEGAFVEKAVAGVAVGAAAAAAAGGGGGGGGAGGSTEVTRRRPAVVTTAHMNMLLYALLKVGHVDEAQALVASMLQQSKTNLSSSSSLSPSLPLPGPDALSFSMVMDALGRKGDWQGALQLLNESHALPTPPSPAALRQLYKTAIAALGKDKMWEGALSLFYEMHERGVAADAQVYTTLLKALKEGGRLESAFEFWRTMKTQKVRPTRPTYNVLFSILGKEGRVEEALGLFREMKEELGVKGTPYDYGTLISACGKAVRREGGREGEVEGLVAQAEELLEEILEEGMPATAAAAATTTTSSSTTSTVSSSSSTANNVFLPSSSSSSSSSSSTSGSRIQDGGLSNCYTQLLKVYGKAGQWEKAVTLLKNMRRDGYVEPSSSHYYEAMRACAFARQPDVALALLKETKEVERRREGGRGRPHILCWNATVLACQRAGRWLGCLELLKTMEGLGQDPGPSNYAWAMQACGEAGREEEAWKLYQELVQRQGAETSSRTALDHVVYGSLLLVCGKAGEVDRVQTLWGDMCKSRDFVPDRLNVAQAVAALAWGCGQIEAAKAMLLPLSKEGGGGGGGGRGKGMVGSGKEFKSSSSAASLLAYHVLMLAVLKYGAPSGKNVSRTCQELVDEMMETHGLCPTSTTKALLARAGCDVTGLFVEEEEVEGWEAAEARVHALLALNPHNSRKRERVCGGE